MGNELAMEQPESPRASSAAAEIGRIIIEMGLVVGDIWGVAKTLSIGSLTMTKRHEIEMKSRHQLVFVQRDA